MIFSKIKNASVLSESENLILNNEVKRVRDKIIDVTIEKGGHLSSNLGIVELTVALHSVFDFPNDKLIFDVGHQCYAHKILSGRGDKFSTLRENDGLSGFPDTEESDYDSFSTGHAGCSMATAKGLSIARDMVGDDYYVIGIVGDGAIYNGINLEALTVDVEKPKKLIVIFNDNGMSISKNENGFYKFVAKKTEQNKLITAKNVKNDDYETDGIFERFGFKYVGVVDGNNVSEMVKVLREVKILSDNTPVFLHVKTLKGKGYKPAEDHADKFHGINAKNAKKGNEFSALLGVKINQFIERGEKVVAITAGMKDGTGLSIVSDKHPKNFFDVGIAEDYAVTFASGLAKGGLKPIVAVYSTFLQRSYDQILHDVCLQNLPVIFAIDRAGFVGQDGKTHQGLFDLSYLSNLPNLTVLAPSCVKDLDYALEYALSLNSPVAIRYPKSSDLELNMEDYHKGLWQTIKDGKKLRILAVGPKMIELALKVSDKLEIDTEVVAVRSVKPLDEKYLTDIPIVTLEENVLNGGFGSTISTYYTKKGISPKVLSFGVDDVFVDHASIEKQLIDNGLTEENIISKIKRFI